MTDAGRPLASSGAATRAWGLSALGCSHHGRARGRHLRPAVRGAGPGDLMQG